MQIADLGWNDYFEQHFERHKQAGYAPARVAREHKELYSVIGSDGELAARISGRMRHNAASKSDFPAVGDWVAVDARADEGTATIHALLPRKSLFSRKVAGFRTEDQVVAANIDTVFLVCGLEGDFSLRRIERYLTVAWEGGARPEVVLNKADLCADVDGAVLEVQAIAPGVPVHAVSALNGLGMAALRASIARGTTAALLGSSGVGKSTLINRLVDGAGLRVGEVRPHDGRGRHVTTWRELVMVPGGGVVVDTPGMRELRLWADRGSLDSTFEDVRELARACRFSDCKHRTEPGCAVRQAVERGDLDGDRLTSYLKLEREVAYLAVRKDLRARIRERTVLRQIAKRSREFKRHDPRKV
jgi:ribosome biogenesis GTPase